MKRPPAGKREVIIETPEMVQLLRLIKDHCFRDLLVFCWDTGCRPQGAKGLSKGQLDLGNSRCAIHHTDAKGKKKQRVIYLTKRASRIVDRNLNGSPYVFLNFRCEPWTSSAVKCRFARLENKIGRRLCQNVFRHSFANRKMKKGVSSIVVAELLGHTYPSMLAKVYQCDVINILLEQFPA